MANTLSLSQHGGASHQYDPGAVAGRGSPAEAASTSIAASCREGREGQLRTGRSRLYACGRPTSKRSHSRGATNTPTVPLHYNDAAATMAALPSTRPAAVPNAPATAARATASTGTGVIPGGPGGRISPGGPPAMIPGLMIRAASPKSLGRRRHAGGQSQCCALSAAGRHRALYFQALAF